MKSSYILMKHITSAMALCMYNLMIRNKNNSNSTLVIAGNEDLQNLLQAPLVSLRLSVQQFENNYL
jgi:hypothetical protein